MSETWTIGELAEHAARALRDGAAAPVNGRVRDVPSERLIRWYTTIGLVDPPLTRRGRIARYGRRHLLQLVAIKRMQAAGHSIAEIQTALAGAEDHTLEAASGLHLPRPETAAEAALSPADPPAGAPPLGRRSPAGGPPASDRAPHLPSSVREPSTSARPLAGRARFWAERPGSRPEGPGPAAGRPAPDPAASTAGRPRRAGSRAARATPGNGRDAASAVMRGVKLADGVRLVLDDGRALTDEDVHAVLAAAGPLLAVLEERELT